MTEKRSLSFQRQSIDHLIALCPNESDTIIDGARQAALTIGWLERQGELLRMLDELRRQRPELFLVMNSIASEFPGARIEKIKEAAE